MCSYTTFSVSGEADKNRHRSSFRDRHSTSITATGSPDSRPKKSASIPDEKKHIGSWALPGAASAQSLESTTSAALPSGAPPTAPPPVAWKTARRTPFNRATGWRSVSVAPLGNAALVVDSSDWAEAAPGSAQEPMCFFSSGMLADFFGRLSGEPVAVMEVECRSRNDERCRFLSASPDTLNVVYEQMKEGRGYEEALRPV